jgi:redox-sensitive bicupin YhaK (pirin superfamily)
VSDAREVLEESAMLTIRRSNERGHANHGWLDSHHTFSFADYHDPRHMGFRALRVLNEDRVAPGQGFGAHGHRDMEIVSYVLAGALGHRDSMGNGSTMRPGDVQRMSAGSGVRHSEMNASSSEPVHFLQIWLLPREAGGASGYEQTHFGEAQRRGRLQLVASETGEDGSVVVRADAKIYATLLARDASVEHVVAPGRHAWIHVAKGSVDVDGATLSAGDGASTSDAGTLRLRGIGGDDDADVLVFDLG